MDVNECPGTSNTMDVDKRSCAADAVDVYKRPGTANTVDVDKRSCTADTMDVNKRPSSAHALADVIAKLLA